VLREIPVKFLVFIGIAGYGVDKALLDLGKRV
jgi:hypothetical protein